MRLGNGTRSLLCCVRHFTFDSGVHACLERPEGKHECASRSNLRSSAAHAIISRESHADKTKSVPPNPPTPLCYSSELRGAGGGGSIGVQVWSCRERRGENTERGIRDGQVTLHEGAGEWLCGVPPAGSGEYQSHLRASWVPPGVVQVRLVLSLCLRLAHRPLRTTFIRSDKTDDT